MTSGGVRPRPALGPDHGLAAAYAARDWPSCAHVLEHWLFDLVFHGDIELLVRVVHEFPEDKRRRSPIVGHLAELFGAVPAGTLPIRVSTDPDDVAAIAMSNTVRDFVSRAVVGFAARRTNGQHLSAHLIARATAAVLDQTASLGPSAEHGPMPGYTVADLKTFIYLQAGLTAHLADDPTMALQVLKQGWRSKAHDTSSFAAHGTAVALAVSTALAGQPEAATRWLDRAEGEPLTSAFAASFAAPGADLARFLIALESTSPEAVEEARLPVADSFERDELWPIRTWALARDALMHSNPEAALALADSVEAHLPPHSNGLHVALLATVRGEAHLALGHATRALSELKRAPTTRYFGRVTEARIALLAGDLAEAEGIATDTIASVALSRRMRIEALLIRAVAELRLGLPKAEASTKRAAGLIDDDGPPSAVLSVPRSALADLAAAIPDAKSLLETRDRLAVDDLYPEEVEIVRLTNREFAILTHLARGIARAEIARTTFVSENTVKQQVRSLYAKLTATSRAEAVLRAQEVGLLGPSGT